jgi:peptidoglycan/LPS O-acetylase OafA/YrhL
MGHIIEQRCHGASLYSDVVRVAPASMPCRRLEIRRNAALSSRWRACYHAGMQEAQSGRLGFLDGLRGWAALAVLLYHSFVEVFYYNHQVARILSYALPLHAPVFVFFVISGFSLSANYVRTGDRGNLSRTAASRYLRLALPILAACCLIYLLMVSDVIPPPDQRIYPLNEYLRFEPSILGVLQFSLFDVFFRFSADQAYILPLWTMEPEFIGSAIIVGILGIFGRLKRRLWIYSTLYIALSVLTPFYVMPGYLALFVAGLVLAELHHRWSPRRMRDHLLLAGLFVFGWFAPYIAATSFVYYTGLIGFCAAAFWLPPIKNFLENRLSRYLGRISFPLYLVHGPVFYSFSLYALDKLKLIGLGVGATYTIVALVTIPVSLACAAAFEPINRGAVWVSRRFGEAVVTGLIASLRQRLATSTAVAADRRS